MQKYRVLGIAGTIIALFAFFDQPLPYFFDKWLLVFLGISVAGLSFHEYFRTRRGEGVFSAEIEAERSGDHAKENL